MLTILFNQAPRPATPGAGAGGWGVGQGGKVLQSPRQPRIQDDPRFDLHAIEEEIILATVTAFMKVK